MRVRFAPIPSYHRRAHVYHKAEKHKKKERKVEEDCYLGGVAETRMLWRRKSHRHIAKKKKRKKRWRIDMFSPISHTHSYMRVSGGLEIRI